MILNFSPSSALWDGAGVAMGTAPQSAVPRRINAHLSNKYWRSLFTPRIHPPGVENTKRELLGGGACALRCLNERQNQLPASPIPEDLGSRAGWVPCSPIQAAPATPAAQGLCVPQTELPLVGCPERKEGFSPAVQGLASPSSPSCCREAKAARSR